MSPIFVPGSGSAPTPSSVVEEVQTDLGDLAALTDSTEILGWLNAGIARLPTRYERDTPITWTAGDQRVNLPADFVRFDRLEVRNGYFGGYEVRGKALLTYDPMSASGTGTVFYFSEFPQIPSNGDSSLLPSLAREAIVSYAKYKFFQKLASNRADFRRYVTITGQSGLEVGDMADLAERHRQDFSEASAELDDQETGESVTAWSD